MSVKTMISYGEFLDKLTILDIKSERIKDKEKLANVLHEYEILTNIWKHHEKSKIDISSEYKSLKEINEKLWEIEDAIREKEKNKEFDNKFINLARSVYISNDERARIKKEINIKLGSDLIEEKSYSDYQ